MANGDSEAGAWEQTLAEMQTLASKRADDGWQTVTVQAANTAPVPPGVGPTDRFGFVYTISEDAVGEIEQITADGVFDEFFLYRETAGQMLFHVLELLDEPNKRGLYVAGAVDLSKAEQLRTAVRDAGMMYVHLELLDRTQVVSFQFEDPAAFFPKIDQ